MLPTDISSDRPVSPSVRFLKETGRDGRGQSGQTERKPDSNPDKPDTHADRLGRIRDRLPAPWRLGGELEQLDRSAGDTGVQNVDLQKVDRKEMAVSRRRSVEGSRADSQERRQRWREHAAEVRACGEHGSNGSLAMPSPSGNHFRIHRRCQMSYAI